MYAIRSYYVAHIMFLVVASLPILGMVFLFGGISFWEIIVLRITSYNVCYTKLLPDNTAPTVTITSAEPTNTNTSPIPVTITFSESVTGFVIGDITVGNGTAGNFSGSGTTYTADITPSAQGAVTVDVAANVAQDAAGNDNTAATQLSRTYDTTSPTAPTVSSAAASTNDTTPTWTWTAGTGGNGTYSRITSYNVCYTKLLRPFDTPAWLMMEFKLTLSRPYSRNRSSALLV